MLLSELLSDFIFKEDSDAADQAKQMGLVYKGFGRWADPRSNKVTHKTDGGRLTKIDPAQTKLGLDDPEVEKDPGRKAGKDAETQARWKEKTPRHGAPSERETREKRVARRQQTTDTVKDIHSQIHDHDWTYDKSDDHSVWKKGEREENKLMDTIAKSGFTYSQTKQIFRRSGGKRLKHGDTVAGETFTTKDWRDILRRRITIAKQVQHGVKGVEPVPPAPTKWDDEKYDSGYMITRSPGYQSLQKKVPDAEDRIPAQPPGHASDVAQLAYARTGDEELATLSRQLSPEDRGDLEKWLDREDLDDMPDFKQMAKDDPEAAERARESDAEDEEPRWSGVDTSYRPKHKVPKDKKTGQKDFRIGTNQPAKHARSLSPDDVKRALK